jgi:cell division septum initiation protein DivIVA
MDFEQQLADLRQEKERLEDEIAELEEKLSEKTSNTEELREDLESLTESIETGRVPASERNGEDNELVAGIPRVEINQETGKPRRGKRSEQIEEAIKVISRKKEEFKAAELFDLLQKADPNIDESQRAYLYSKLNDLKDQGELEKVKRGTWTLAD